MIFWVFWVGGFKGFPNRIASLFWMGVSDIKMVACVWKIHPLFCVSLTDASFVSFWDSLLECKSHDGLVVATTIDVIRFYISAAVMVFVLLAVILAAYGGGIAIESGVLGAPDAMSVYRKVCTAGHFAAGAFLIIKCGGVLFG